VTGSVRRDNSEGESITGNVSDGNDVLVPVAEDPLSQESIHSTIIRTVISPAGLVTEGNTMRRM